MKRFIFLFVLLSFFDAFAKQKTWTGTASYYSSKFEGRKTASGEIFSNAKLTCANNFLPFGTYIKVTNLSNNKSVIVKVNDRLHAKNKRLVDLTVKAAKTIGITHHGLGRVIIQRVSKSSNKEDSYDVEK